MFSLPSLLAASALLVGVAWADTCSEVEQNTNVRVTRPLSLAYIDEQTEYWSQSCSALKPSCIIFPKSAAEVAEVVTILASNSEQFAVKSGGHSPNNLWASVDGGPLIATQDLDQVDLDQATGIVDVGPGNRLDGLAQQLQGTGWTVIGGRIGNTGVGGLILGGGLSYMSAQYGWTASTVIEYEVVLADGSIVYASENEHADLYLALKGGGNNFGIVTNYKIQAKPQGLIWGGNLLFVHTDAVATKLLKAVRDFTEFNDDHKAAVIVTAERAPLDLVDSWILFLFYDGEVVPDGIFDDFLAAGPLTNTFKKRAYADFVTESNWVIVPGINVQIGTETIPRPASNQPEVLEDIHAHWRETTDQELLTAGIIMSIAYQPFPKIIAQRALEAGGDLIDVPADIDRMIIETNWQFLLPTDYPRIENRMIETYGGIRDRVLSYQAAGTLADAFLPVFANYGFYKQDYWGRLKPENRAFAKGVADEYDPEGLFRDRTGGWKP